MCHENDQMPWGLSKYVKKVLQLRLCLSKASRSRTNSRSILGHLRIVACSKVSGSPAKPVPSEDCA